MTTLQKLKAEVTRYFSARKVSLRSMSTLPVGHDSDFFELVVLARIAEALGTVGLEQTEIGRNGEVVYKAALSPSPRWKGASFLSVQTASSKLGLRSGLSVQTSDGCTAELDVVAVNLNAQGADDEVQSASVEVAMECKAHARRTTLTVADGIIGKACRVWNVPVPPRPLSAVPSFAVAALSDADPSARKALSAQGIAHCKVEHVPGELENYLRDLARTF